MANEYDHYAAHIQQELQKGERLSHRFIEKPAMKSVLPNLEGKKVLMLGCGTGEESMLLEEYGATSLTGVDLSAESVRLASESYPKHTFSVGDMHKLNFKDDSFDFVYSSLAIHYSEDPLVVYKEVRRVLKSSGSLQFSTVHPMRWASERIEIDGAPTKVLGYSEGEEKPRLYGSYSRFAQYSETFRGGEILEFWVAPPSFHFNLLKQAGFVVEEFIEAKAVEECKKAFPYYFERFSEFPQFAVFVAK